MLYEATFDASGIPRPLELADVILERFARFRARRLLHHGRATRRNCWSRAARICRTRPIPSGNSAAALGLLRLSRLSGEARHEAAARGVLRLNGPVALRFPSGFGHLLQALAFDRGPVREVAIVGEVADGAGPLARAVRIRFRPFTVLAGGPPVAGDETTVPLLAGRRLVGDRPAAYVCERFTCQAPVTEPEQLVDLAARLTRCFGVPCGGQGRPEAGLAVKGGGPGGVSGLRRVGASKPPGSRPVCSLERHPAPSTLHRGCFRPPARSAPRGFRHPSKAIVSRQVRAYAALTMRKGRFAGLALGWAVAALLLVGCGTSSPAAPSALDPANLAPASALIYVSVTVRPQGSLATQMRQTLTKLGGPGAARSILGSINQSLRKKGMSYGANIRPWLGQRVGLVLTQFPRPGSRRARSRPGWP